MGFNKFSIYIILRILLIQLNLIGITATYDRSDLFYTLLFLLLILVFQVVMLINFVNKTNEELSKFISALRDTDYTTNFPEAQNKTFHKLYSGFQKTLAFYQSKETKYEAQFLFIQQIIDHIETGILAIDHDQKILLSNKMANKFRNEYRYENDETLLNSLAQISASKVITGKSVNMKKVSLLVNKTSFKILDQERSIYTFKDISSSLSDKEIHSWQKLIRILAHEIINSLTPITSLSETTLQIMKNNSYEEAKDDIELGLQTIKDRAEGLLTFMEDYRKLIKIPEPKTEEVVLSDLMKNIVHLFKSDFNQILWKQDFQYPTIQVDKIQFEQIMINLITNSIQALESKTEKSITIKSRQSSDFIIVEVTDNGSGMDAPTLEKSLIPFFTTKDSGSGIGLSLVQQIMNNHGGSVEIISIEHEFTTIQLFFLTPRL